jgi:hypothetical protein
MMPTHLRKEIDRVLLASEDPLIRLRTMLRLRVRFI